MRDACMRVLRVAVVAACAGLPVACTPKGPPPRPVEIPIDNSPPSGTIMIVPSDSSASVEVAGVPQAGGARPTPVAVGPAPTDPSAPTGSPTSQPVPPFPAPGPTHAPLPKAQRLTPAECIRVMDKYVGIIAVSQGVAADQVKAVVPVLKQTVAADPNFGATQTACLTQTSKKQYACAMKSTSVDAWKACLE
jgi:hypothetical protein